MEGGGRGGGVLWSMVYRYPNPTVVSGLNDDDDDATPYLKFPCS